MNTETILGFRLCLFVLSSFALPLPFVATFVLIWSSVLVLNHTSAKPIFSFIDLKLNFRTVIQPCVRFLRLYDVLPSYIDSSLIISARRLTTVLDLLIRGDETKTFVSIEEFNCTGIDGLLIYVPVILCL